MTDHVPSGPPDPSETVAVQYALRAHDEGFALAMTFDPGDAPSTTLGNHAIDIMLGLMHLRRWRHDGQPMWMGRACEWYDPWWAQPLGPHALVVESELDTADGTSAGDIKRIVGLTQVAWCMERELRLAEQPIPDLMTAFAPGGLVLASIDPEPLRVAMHALRGSIAERRAALPESMRSPTHAHVLIHLEGTALRPWSLPERTCAFRSTGKDPAVERVFRRARGHLRGPAPGDRPRAPAPDARERAGRLARGRRGPSADALLCHLPRRTCSSGPVHRRRPSTDGSPARAASV